MNLQEKCDGKFRKEKGNSEWWIIDSFVEEVTLSLCLKGLSGLWAWRDMKKDIWGRENCIRKWIQSDPNENFKHFDLFTWPHWVDSTGFMSIPCSLYSADVISKNLSSKDNRPPPKKWSETYIHTCIHPHTHTKMFSTSQDQKRLFLFQIVKPFALHDPYLHKFLQTRIFRNLKA